MIFIFAEEIRIGKIFSQLNIIVMKVISEISLTSFEFWAGAKANAERLTYEEMEQIEEIIEELYPDGIDEVNINDLFWLSFS